MEAIDKVHAKIAALLSKTELNGASEAEANAAMNVAQKLMTEHGITLHDLKNNTSAANDFTKRRFNEGAKNLSMVDKFVVTAIATYTDTKCWNTKEFSGFTQGKKRTRTQREANIMFYGYSVDVELAHYIYKICDMAVEAEWKKFAVTLPAGSRSKSRVTFQLGMCSRLRSRLLEMKEKNVEATNGTSLIVLKSQLVKIAFEENTKINLKPAESSVTKYRPGNVFEAGKLAGDNVLFNREVRDGPTGGIKLIA